MAFKPIDKLEVKRTLSDSSELMVGVLAQNRQGVYFQFEESYLDTYGNLSPFSLAFNREVQLAPKNHTTGCMGSFLIVYLMGGGYFYRTAYSDKII